MNYNATKIRACHFIDNFLKGCKEPTPIDAIILKIESEFGLGEKFVRARLERIHKIDPARLMIDKISDEVTWNE